MQHPTIPFGECKAVTAAGGLVVSSINRNTGIMTEQKRANGTVANEDHIAGSVSGQDVFDLPNNAQLGIDGALPAPNTGKWLREKLICHGLEFAGHQETCRRSVVLVHRLPHLDADVQFRSNDLGCFNRLSFAAGDELRRT